LLELTPPAVTLTFDLWGQRSSTHSAECLLVSYASGTVRKVPSVLYPRASVGEWVCASRKPCEHHLTNQWREFQPILATDVFGLVYVLVRFWGQRSKVKGQGHSRGVIPSTATRRVPSSYFCFRSCRNTATKIIDSAGSVSR